MFTSKSTFFNRSYFHHKGTRFFTKSTTAIRTLLSEQIIPMQISGKEKLNLFSRYGNNFLLNNCTPCEKPCAFMVKKLILLLCCFFILHSSQAHVITFCGEVVPIDKDFVSSKLICF